MVPGNPAYHIPIAYRVRGELDIPALGLGFKRIIERHEAWRTTFHELDGDAVQKVHLDGALQISFTSLEHLSFGEREKEAAALAAWESVKPFDLGQLPLLRVSLFRIDVREHILLIVFHHIIADGLSVSLMFDELDAAYQAAKSGAPPQLPELKAQFPAYSPRGKGDELAKPSYSPGASSTIGEKQLEGDLPILEFPADKPLGRSGSHSLDPNVDFAVPKDLAEALTAIGKEERCTFYVTILAALQSHPLLRLLERGRSSHRDAGREQAASRNRPSHQRNFINILALRCDVSGNPAFAELLQRSRDTTLDALSNKDLSFRDSG